MGAVGWRAACCAFALGRWSGRVCNSPNGSVSRRCDCVALLRETGWSGELPRGISRRHLCSRALDGG